MAFTELEILKINELISAFPVNTEVSVSKIIKGEPTFYGAVRHDDGVREVVNHDSIFEIGSITKVMTSSVMTSMALDNDIKIDAPINPLFDFNFYNNNHEITFKSLSTHTSGLPRLPRGVIWKALFTNRLNPYSSCDEKALRNYLQHHLKLKAKKSINYSNLGIGLLGVALEKASGDSYSNLVSEKIFKPLNMTNSGVSKNDLTGRTVQGLNVKGDAAITWDFGFLSAAGAVLSSVEDLTKYVLANFDRNYAIFEYQKRAVIEEKDRCIALGWFILDKVNKGERMYFHNGGTSGFSSAVLMDIQEENAFIVLSNISGLHKIKGQRVDHLIFSLMKEIQNKT